MNVLYVILLLSFVQVLNQDNFIDEYVKYGLKLEQEDQPVQALALWQQAINELDIPSVAIATEYLRVATQHELHDYYPSATFNYRWGMSGSNKTAMVANRQSLKEELARLEPLVNQGEFKHWQSMLEESDPELFDEIHRFWARLDIRPSTTYNERLIEHWKRMAYAREHFTRRNEPPYGTDTKGRYYVKYGEPDRIESGRIDVTRDKIQWILTQLMPPPTPDDLDANFGNEDLMLLSNRISQLFLNPNYEIWIYDSPGEQMTQNLVLIFGHKLWLSIKFIWMYSQ